MMYFPGEEFRKKMKMVEPWLYMDTEKEELVLRDDAPRKVKEAYEYCRNSYPKPDF